ncbi:hypothetical protein OAO01_04950 [Oligoflexia bacterium]|nr:hypothetical protein [Oligoflexia bacterium]
MDTAEQMNTIVEELACKRCQSHFAISSWEHNLHIKVEVPTPVLCPACRSQLRLMHLNQLHLFQGQCAGTGDRIITHFPPNSPYKVCSQAYWYSDAVNNTEYGREFDFGRPFFDQFHELSLDANWDALATSYTTDENCDFTNYCGNNKNCYLIFNSNFNWDCYYSYGLNDSKNSLDCTRAQGLELCCETIDSTRCYGCAHIFNSENCSDSFFLNNCIACSNCIMCCNLHHKEYHYRNQPIAQEKFQELKKLLARHASRTEMEREFKLYRLKYPEKYLRGFHNESVSGNNLLRCKNALHCYDGVKIEDGMYCNQMFDTGKDCLDCDECGGVEVTYASMNSGINSYNLLFCFCCDCQVSNLTYCVRCTLGCSHLFGCVGLKKKQYCILNREYREEEYLELVPRIIAHMRDTGEWGQFFPAKLSPYPYNITLAQDHFPLTKAEAVTQGYRWLEPDQREYKPATCKLPDQIQDVPESICQELLACSECSKNYKIIPQELRFYQQIGLALPRTCFQCRHHSRFGKRTGRILFPYRCDACQAPLQTAHAPDTAQKIYCEKCFQDQLY